MLNVQMKKASAIGVHLKEITVPLDRYPQGYEAGFADGTEAGIKEGFAAGKESAEEENAATLVRINTALKEAGGWYIQEDAQTLADVPGKVPYVYDNGFEQGFTKGMHDGKQFEHDRFWDSVQANGTRTDYNCAFRYWTDSYFHPKYKVVPNNVQPNSAYAMLQFMTNLKKVEAAYIDMSALQDTSSSYNAFALVAGCTALEEVEDIGLHGGLYYYATFYRSKKLHTIAKIRSATSTKWNITFAECESLKNITFEGMIGQNGLSFADSPKLSKASIESVIGALSDTATGKSVTFAKAAIVAAYGSTESGPWLVLCDTKPNWTISLV